MNDTLRNRVLWAITVLFGLFAFLKATPLASSLMAFIPAVSIIVPTVFAFTHGSRRLGWPAMAVFFAIAFVVSWCMESLSIATGFPFGNYHYTAKLGPKLGTVPLLIMPAYFAMCYVSWNLAHIVLDKFDHRADALQRWAVPVIAAFIMVMWDLSMDPSRATAAQAWIWHDGGSYFGVPFVNFMGWALTVYLIFQIFALVLARQQPQRDPATNGDNRRETWHLNTAFYFATFVEFPAMAWLAADRPLTDAAQVVWSARAMYESLGLVSLFTMGFVCCLAFIAVRKAARLH
jgi:putative membrane protein